MSIIPTVRGRRSGSASETTSGRKDETILRLWNFLNGLRTNGLRVYGQGASSGSMLVASNSDGDVAFSSTLPSTSFTDTAQTASQTGTIIASASGEYLVTVFAETTTAGTGGTLDGSVTFTDDNGARTTTLFTGLDLTLTTGPKNAAVVVRCASGGIDYTFTVTGAAGTPKYNVYLNIVKLR